MTWQVVHLADVTPTRWKNGGGTTRELVAWPDAAHWVWRMSVAEVAQSGPFSRFDGVQRWFAVLGGAGVALTHYGTRHTLTIDSAPFCFDGGGPTACELRDGATQDFNLMRRVAGAVNDEASVATQTGASAAMTRVRGSASVTVSVSPNTIKLVAAYAISTRARALFNGENMPISSHSLVWRPVAAHDAIQIEAEDALLMEIEMTQNSTGQPTQVNQAVQMTQAAATHAATGMESVS